jgi:hypothetical protein
MSNDRSFSLIEIIKHGEELERMKSGKLVLFISNQEIQSMPLLVQSEYPFINHLLDALIAL